MKQLIASLAFAAAAFAQPNPSVQNYVGNILGSPSSSTLGAITGGYATLKKSVAALPAPKIPLICLHRPMAADFLDPTYSTAANFNTFTDSVYQNAGVRAFSINVPLNLPFADGNNYLPKIDAGINHMLALSPAPTIQMRMAINASFVGAACTYSGNHALGWCSANLFTGGTPNGITGFTAAMQYAEGTLLSRSLNTGTWGSHADTIDIAHEFQFVVNPNANLPGGTPTAAQWQTFVDNLLTVDQSGATALKTLFPSARYTATVVGSGTDIGSLATLLGADTNLWGVGIDLYYTGNPGVDGADMTHLVSYYNGVLQTAVPNITAGGRNWFAGETAVPYWSFTGVQTSPPPGEGTAIWGGGSPFTSAQIDREFWRIMAQVVSAYGGKSLLLFSAFDLIWAQPQPACRYTPGYANCVSSASSANCQCQSDNYSLNSTYTNTVLAKIQAATTGGYLLGTSLSATWKELNTYWLQGMQ